MASSDESICGVVTADADGQHLVRQRVVGREDAAAGGQFCHEVRNLPRDAEIVPPVRPRMQTPACAFAVEPERLEEGGFAVAAPEDIARRADEGEARPPDGKELLRGESSGGLGVVDDDRCVLRQMAAVGVQEDGLDAGECRSVWKFRRGAGLKDAAVGSPELEKGRNVLRIRRHVGDADLPLACLGIAIDAGHLRGGARMLCRGDDENFPAHCRTVYQTFSACAIG